VALTPTPNPILAGPFVPQIVPMRTHGKVSCALLAQGIWAGMRVVSLTVKCNLGRTVMKPLYRRIAGLDVHRMLYVLTVLIELDDGTVTQHQRSFGGFQRDLRDLVAWLLELGVELVVMGSTGGDFQSVYAALEKAGIPAHVVNARHVKNVPGRKTDISGSAWLAQLGRFGLVKPSFIPPQDLGQPRHPLPVVRSRQCRQANPQHPARQVQSLVPRKGHKKAIIAVAHKMVRTIFILFTRRQAYRDPGIDYQAIVVSKNAPRWIQALKKYGYWPKSASVQTPAPAPAH
jgi:hypothetical protein